MKKAIVISLISVVCFSGCMDFLNPSYSKAMTEKSQLAELRTQNAELRKNTAALERIATALEKMSSTIE